MSTSRREFIKQGSLVALAAGASTGIIREVMGKETVSSARFGSDLTRAAFSAQLNTQFRVSQGGKQVLLKLVEVSELAHRKGSRPGREGFSLLFRGARANVLEQQTYRMDHQELGTFSFLVVPVQNRSKNIISYEVIVNRLYP